MAGKQIKGITLEINGDTTKLGKALSDIESRSKNTSTALREIERSLKFNPGNTELVTQQQRTLKQAISETKDKLSLLQEADRQAKQQLANGELGQEQYDALQREIIQTENQLGSYEQKLASSKSEQQKLKDATDKLRTIFEKSGKSVDEFADLVGEDTVEAFKKGEGSSAQMERALDRLGQELFGTKGNTEVLHQVLKQLDDGVSFESVVRGAKESTEELESLEKASGEAKDSVKDINDTAIEIQGLNATLELFEKLGDVAQRVAQEVTEAWIELDEAQDTIVKKTGASGEALDDMREVFHDVYTSMPTDAQKVGNAIGELNTQFNLHGKKLNDATRLMLKFADINDADVTRSTQLARGAMDQFKLSAEDLGSVLDVVTQVGQNTGVASDVLFQKVTEGAPALQALGLGFDESVALMGRFEQSGVNSTKVLSYLTKAQVQASKEGKSLTEALSEFSEQADLSEDDTKALNEAAKLFGTKGGAMMLKVAEDGRLSFDDLSDAVSDAGGTVEKTFEEIQDPADEWLTAQNSIKDVLAELGEILQTVFAPVLLAVAGGLRFVSDLFRNLPGPIKAIIGVVAALAGGLLAAGTAVGLFKTASSLLAPVFEGIHGAFAGLATLVQTNPMLLIIGGIVAAVALLIANWDTVCAVAQQVWDFLVACWTAIWEFLEPILTQIGEFFATIWEGIQTSVQSVIDFLSQLITTAWNGISSFLSGILNGISGFFISVWRGISSTVGGVIQGIGVVIHSVFDGIVGYFSGIFAGVQQVFQGIIDFIAGVFTGNWGRAWEGVKSIFQGIVDTLGAIFKAPINFIIEGINWFIRGLNTIRIPDWVPGIGGAGIYLDEIPYLAKGGIIDRPTFAMIGEAGREAVIPLERNTEWIDQVAEKLAGRGSAAPNFVFNINKVEVREESDIQRIAEELYRIYRRRELALS